MNCPKCGVSNSDGAKFCASCGAAMAAAPGGGPKIPEFAKDIITPGLIARVKAIILSPATEWPVIDAETTTPREIYIKYVAPLAAIGAVAGFIGQSVVGVNVPFYGTVRTPILSGLVMAVVMYALAFLSVFLITVLIDALAPTFGGQKDSMRALKVSAYSYTPGWIAAVLQILPPLSFIGALAGLYGIYILYLGLPVLMRCPKDKAIAYTAVLCVCVIVLYMAVGMVVSRVLYAGNMFG